MRFISKPTTNNKNAIPNSEICRISCSSLIIPHPIGPKIKPVSMYAGISGCFNIFAIKAIIVAIIINRPISVTILLFIEYNISEKILPPLLIKIDLRNI